MHDEERINNHKNKDAKTVCQYCGKKTSILGLTRHQQGYKCKFLQSSHHPQGISETQQLDRLEEFFRFLEIKNF